jgi:hypothetical protein
VILSATSLPQRMPRVFRCPTQLAIQVGAGGSVFFTRTQGDSAAGFGVELTNANTNGGQPPYTCWWQGDLWYRTTAAGPIDFNVEILSEEGVS